MFTLSFEVDTSCGLSGLSWPSSSPREEAPREESQLEKTPRDIVFLILDRLPLRDLLAVGVTCRKLNNLVNHDRFWKPLNSGALFLMDSERSIIKEEGSEYPSLDMYPELDKDSTQKQVAMGRIRYFSICSSKDTRYLIPEFLFKEKAFALMCVERDGHSLNGFRFSEEIRSDREIVLKAFRRGLSIKQWDCPSTMRSDRSIALELTREGFLCLEDLWRFSFEIQRDKEIWFEALRHVRNSCRCEEYFLICSDSSLDRESIEREISYRFPNHLYTIIFPYFFEREKRQVALEKQRRRQMESDQPESAKVVLTTLSIIGLMTFAMSRLLTNRI